MRIALAILATLFLSLMALPAIAAEERFPIPEFQSGYVPPETVVGDGLPAWRSAIDVAVLAGALGVGAWIVLKKRSRKWVVGLMLFSLAYFGFFRQGCICSIGAIQNVAHSVGGGYALPWMVAAFFLLPLLVAIFAGRIFCAGVCPLGAMQDLALWRPVRVAPWLESGLGLFAHFYLATAIVLAAVGGDFIICRFDPFVGFFRLSGPSHMIILGGVVLGTCVFVGRAYCRFVCPYSVLLRIVSPLSRRKVSITPGECIDCRLCEPACPFGAVRHPVPAAPEHEIRTARRQLSWLMLALPLIVGALTWLGYAGAGLIWRTDARVQLAEQVHMQIERPIEDVSDEVKAFRLTGLEPEEAYADGRSAQRRISIGMALVGGWMGLVIGLRLIRHTLRRRREGYTADDAACVACARCYLSCPVEHERLKAREEAVA